MFIEYVLLYWSLCAFFCEGHKNGYISSLRVTGIGKYKKDSLRAVEHFALFHLASRRKIREIQKMLKNNNNKGKRQDNSDNQGKECISSD